MIEVYRGDFSLNIPPFETDVFPPVLPSGGLVRLYRKCSLGWGRKDGGPPIPRYLLLFESSTPGDSSTWGQANVPGPTERRCRVQKRSLAKLKVRLSPGRSVLPACGSCLVRGRLGVSRGMNESGLSAFEERIPGCSLNGFPKDLTRCVSPGFRKAGGAVTYKKKWQGWGVRWTSLKKKGWGPR